MILVTGGSGSGAYAEDGIVQRALREARAHFPEMYLITDVCMCEYTSHGHCGLLKGHDVEIGRASCRERVLRLV